MPTEKKANHQVNVVRLGAPRVHTNADKLELFDIGGYQVVTQKGNFLEGDLAIYIQPDSVVPQMDQFAFLWEPYVTDKIVENGVTRYPDWPAGVPDRRRRITVRKFRKEWSEGLLMPVADFGYVNPDGVAVVSGVGIVEGGDVSDLIGITHWTGDDVESTESSNDSRPKRERPRTLKGWFFYLLFHMGLKSVKRALNEELAFDVPKFDVENIKNFKNTITPFDPVIVTEKIHGSQGRYFFKEGRMYVGSRNFWKAPKSACVWRKALAQHSWIEEYCRANEGNILYGEVVPTQKGWRYGCDEGETNFFVFDIRDGLTGEYLPKQATMKTGGITRVPVIFEGVYGEGFAADGPSLVKDAKTNREGIVITVTDPTRWQRGLGRIQLKQVSNAFLEKDSK